VASSDDIHQAMLSMEHSGYFHNKKHYRTINTCKRV